MAPSIQTPIESRAIISRKDALQRGLIRYFTGKPCKHGHIAERNPSNKACLECARLKSREEYWSDPAKAQARRKALRQANPERAKAGDRAAAARWKKNNPEKVNALNRAWREKNPEKSLAFRLRWEEKHKQRIQDDPVYAENFRIAIRIKNEEQKRKRDLARTGSPRPDACEVCGKKSEEICFDHCHQSGAFRGWLCHACNQALGLANDSPDLLRRLAEYLKQQKH